MEKLYGLLCQFSNNTHVSGKRLERAYSRELLDHALAHGYIRLYRYNEDGEPVYTITPEGKAARDG